MKKQIEALKKLVSLKDETIKELERQIQLLKNQSTVTLSAPVLEPYSPTHPFIGGGSVVPLTFSTPTDDSRFTNPLPIVRPINPLFPSYTVTYNTPNHMGTNLTFLNPNDPNITYTVTNSDGSTNVVDINKIARC